MIRIVSKTKFKLFPRWKTNRKKLKVGVTDQMTTITSFKKLNLAMFSQTCVIRVFGARELVRKQDRMNV